MIFINYRVRRVRATITVGTVLKVNGETGPSNTRCVDLTCFRTIIYEFYKVFFFF